MWRIHPAAWWRQWLTGSPTPAPDHEVPAEDGTSQEEVPDQDTDDLSTDEDDVELIGRT